MPILYDPLSLRRTLGPTFTMYCVLEGLDPSDPLDEKEGARRIEDLMKVGGAPTSTDELRSRVYLAAEEKLAHRLYTLAPGVRPFPRARGTAWTTSMSDHVSEVAREVSAKFRSGTAKVPSAQEFDNYLRRALRYEDGDAAKTAARMNLPKPQSQLGRPDMPSLLETIEARVTSTEPDAAPMKEVLGDRRAVVEALALLHDMASPTTEVAGVADEMFLYILFENERVGQDSVLPRVNVWNVFAGDQVAASLARARALGAQALPRVIPSEDKIALEIDDHSIPGLDGFAVWYAGRLLEDGKSYDAHARNLKRFREALDVRVAFDPNLPGAWLVRAIADGETPMCAFAKAVRARLPVSLEDQPLSTAPLVRSLFVIEQAPDAVIRTLEPRDHALALRLRTTRGPSNLTAELLGLDDIAAALDSTVQELVERVREIAATLDSRHGAAPWIEALLARLRIHVGHPVDAASIATLLWRIAATHEAALLRLPEVLSRRAQFVRDWALSPIDSPLPATAEELRELGGALNADDVGGWQCWCDVCRPLLGKEQFKSARPIPAAIATLEALWIIQTAEAVALSQLDDSTRRIAEPVRGGSLDGCVLATPTDRTSLLAALLPESNTAGLDPKAKRKQTEEAKKHLNATLDGLLILTANTVRATRATN